MALSTTDGEEIALKIRDWLKASRQGSPSPELEEFIVDLEQGRNIGVWAGVDFERIIPYVPTKSRLSRLLGILRNGLVFLPILLTWWALRDAVELFAENATTGDNFLVFWQKLEGFTKLSTVALLDVGIILAVILLTLFVGIFEEEGRFTRKLSRKYEGLIVLLERKLSGYRYLSLEDINMAAEGTLGALLASTQEIQTAAQAFAEASTGAREAVFDVSTISKDILEPVLQRTQAITTVLSSAAGAHSDMAQLVTDNQNALRNQLHAMQESIQESAKRIDGHTSSFLSNIERDLASSANSLSTSARDISNRFMSDMSSQLQQFAAEYAKIGELLREIVADVAESAATIQSSAVVLRADLKEIHYSLQDLIQR